MKIFLVRHGESIANVDPEVYKHMADHAIPLSPLGWEQARESGLRLKEYWKKLFSRDDEPGLSSNPVPHIRIWNSPYVRARQTADALEGVLGSWIADRHEHILLCEQQFGLFGGLPDHLLPALFPDEYRLYKRSLDFEGKFWARVPMGESRFDVAQRVHQSFGTFQRDREYDDITHLVVVCHGVTLRAFVMMWCHHSPEWFESEPNPKNGAIRVLEGTQDRGYLFEGFDNRSPEVFDGDDDTGAS